MQPLQVGDHGIHEQSRKIQLAPKYDLINTDAPITMRPYTPHWRATLGAGSNPIMPNVSAYSPDPPMMPSMYPIPEYRPSKPQSAAQPEMVDTVKTGIIDESSPDSLHDRY